MCDFLRLGRKAGMMTTKIGMLMFGWRIKVSAFGLGMSKFTVQRSVRQAFPYSIQFAWQQAFYTPL